MQDILLTVQNLGKFYGAKHSAREHIQVVHPLSFSIVRGTTVGLIGESGSGKSTIGQMLLNLLPASSGRVEYDGHVLFDIENKVKISEAQMRRLRCEMQVVLQNSHSSLDPQQNVLQSVMEGPKKHKLYASSTLLKNAAEDLLKDCELGSELFYRHVHQLSGGQRQRVSIARALALNPKFIVCDEPTAALDVSVQARILNLLLDLKEKRGLTLLLITHNLEIAYHICDEILVLSQGRIVERGNASSIYHNPQHLYTQTLLESIPKGFKITKL